MDFSHQISFLQSSNLPGSLRTEGRWVDALLWLLALPISGLAGGSLVKTIWGGMVDGSEIRRSPVDMVNIPVFTRFYIIKGSLAEKLPIYERHPSKVKSIRVVPS